MPEGICDPVGSPPLKQAPARTCGPLERGAQPEQVCWQGV